MLLPTRVRLMLDVLRYAVFRNSSCFGVFQRRDLDITLHIWNVSTASVSSVENWHHGPLTRYVKLRVAHVPEMPGTFSHPTRVSDPDMHHGPCVKHVPWCMSGSLTNDFYWSRWRVKRSRYSSRMRNPQFFVSGKRSMVYLYLIIQYHRVTCRSLEHYIMMYLSWMYKKQGNIVSYYAYFWRYNII